MKTPPVDTVELRFIGPELTAPKNLLVFEFGRGALKGRTALARSNGIIYN